MGVTKEKRSPKLTTRKGSGRNITRQESNGAPPPPPSSATPTPLPKHPILSKGWKPLPNLSSPCQDAASVVITVPSSLANNPAAEYLPTSTNYGTVSVILLAGGRTADLAAISTVEALEWNLQRDWWKLPSLKTPRCGCAMVALQNPNSPAHPQIYVIGGMNDKCQPLSSMETFGQMVGISPFAENPIKEWTDLYTTPMATPRMHCAAVALHQRQELMVAGGRDGSWEELDTVEIFSVLGQSWRHIAPMSSKRFACGLVHVPSTDPVGIPNPSQGQVLAMGGYNGKEWTTSCETYDIKSDTWSPLPDMPQAVKFCVATILELKQYATDYIVVRGQSVSHPNKAILQCYRISSQKWIVLPFSSLTLGSALVSLSNRLCVIGGASGEDVTPHCQCWQATTSALNKYFSSSAAAPTNNSTTDKVPSIPALPRVGRYGSSEVEEGTQRTDDDSMSHPLFAGPPPAYVIPSGTPIAESSSTSRKSRPKVDNFETKDNFGVPVLYTGYLTSDSRKPHGKGRMTWKSTGDIYEGRFEKGTRQGRGRMMYCNGDKFEGMFQEDQREGKGVYQYRDGRIYEGNYVDDMAEDINGVMRWRDGTIYQGQFSKSKRTGKAKIIFPSKVQYDGDFVNGKYHGKGICQFADGSIYSGQWKLGKAHGRGRLTNAQGEVVYSGKWANDGPVYT